MKKPKHFTPEREFGFQNEPFQLVGEAYREAVATLARNDKEGEHADDDQTGFEFETKAP